MERDIFSMKILPSGQQQLIRYTLTTTTTTAASLGKRKPPYCEREKASVAGASVAGAWGQTEYRNNFLTLMMTLARSREKGKQDPNPITMFPKSN